MMPSFIKRICLFYFHGFRQMGTLGRTLWLIILIKLFVMFGLLRPIFFPRHLQGDEAQKAQQVSEQLINRAYSP